MKIPSLFVHYWTENQTLTSFHDVMNWDIDPIILEIIQTEINHQLHSESIQRALPNFNWGTQRFMEKWESMTQNLVPQVALPEKIWLDWIQYLTDKTISTEEEPKPNGLEEIYQSFEALLNAEVYYSSPADSLDDPIEKPIIEEIDQTTLESTNLEEINPDEVLAIPIFIQKETFEILEITSAALSLAPEEIFSLSTQTDKIEEITQKVSEELDIELTPIEHNDIGFSVINLEIGNKAPTEKKVLDILGESPQEKVYERLQINQDDSLKDRIHKKMTSSLAETLPLFQKINFIQNLFDGESEFLDQIIEFIDQEAISTNWKEVLQSKYHVFQREDNQALWHELYDIIERKFS
jgi:hypothetical protein